MAIAFKADRRGVLSQMRLTTSCCGGVCLTKQEDEWLQQKNSKGLPMECPVHGSTGEVLLDLDWYDEFAKAGIVPQNENKSFSKEVRRPR